MKTKLMGTLTMLCSLLGCNAQSEGFKNPCQNGYSVMELDDGYNGWVGNGNPVVK